MKMSNIKEFIKQRTQRRRRTGGMRGVSVLATLILHPSMGPHVCQLFKNNKEFQLQNMYMFLITTKEENATTI